MKRAIREHWKDFAAIVGLLVITVAIAGYILSNERLRFPWESSPYCARPSLCFRIIGSPRSAWWSASGFSSNCNPI